MDNTGLTPIILNHAAKLSLSVFWSSLRFDDVTLKVGPIKGDYDMILGIHFLSQFNLSASIFYHSLQSCWNAHSGTNPCKRRAQSGCSLIELQNNKQVVCGSRSDVRDVKKLIEHDQRSSNFNFVTPNSNSSKLLDRISTPFIGSSENHQL
ncbi:hypothetical protein Pst134EA_013738 [Puccinia striiformis f. sp. tritici]|uniref:hypothetical protein n=1 Tax=Puccinia striiformis f. sp. tritici TaxID=168172 RepID=UPI00200800E6|nr:hypothetical protein Pst134EA_013738 [Puccinia striiformis f. sp. tritici]KAH9465878.1 hypothetical protein Pst134EA_013738 [Puccinia striiformis f. sp. tritici]